MNSCSEALKALFNKTVLTRNFHNELKLDDVIPVFLKKDLSKSKSYKLVSALPVLSKIFDRIMHTQMSSHADHILSLYLCGYRKG